MGRCKSTRWEDGAQLADAARWLRCGKTRGSRPLQSQQKAEFAE